MATTIRAQIAWQIGSMLPRDRFTITPYFSHTQVDNLGDGDYQTLAEDLATAIKGWEMAPTNHELTVKLYNMNDTSPRRPKATAIRQANAAQNASFMREIALCLSFGGGNKTPRERGRLYIPHVKCSNSAPAVRPTSTERDKVGALAAIFSNLGGLNVDWSVYSPTTKQDTTVKYWYVDDEWDVQRRRGDRPTTRTSGSTDG